MIISNLNIMLLANTSKKYSCKTATSCMGLKLPKFSPARFSLLVVSYQWFNTFQQVHASFSNNFKCCFLINPYQLCSQLLVNKYVYNNNFTFLQHLQVAGTVFGIQILMAAGTNLIRRVVSLPCYSYLAGFSS